MMYETRAASERLNLGPKRFLQLMASIGVSPIRVCQRGRRLWYWPAVERALAEASARQTRQPKRLRPKTGSVAELFRERYQ